MLEFSDDQAFLRSEARGAFLVIIGDWYRDRYGDAVDDRKEDIESMVLVHGTPFAMRVPIQFKLVSEEPNTFCIGFPASVQAEEDPLAWIQSGGVVRGLSDSELVTIRKAALATANLIRSINVDTRCLEDNANPNVAALAGSVRSDIESAARNLCAQNDAGLRSALWDASQATEKSLKILIWRKRQAPSLTHDLSSLADRAQEFGAGDIDRAELALIPSGRNATGIRYGGRTRVSEATAVYRAALSIIAQVAFEAQPESDYSLREARLKMTRPPWFSFDTEKFSKRLRST